MPRFLWPAGSGAGATCPPDWINVTCAPYNAVGDDSTDDTGAIVAAAAAAQAAPNGPVPLYFPAGTYIYNGGVAGVTLSLGAIFGDGPGLSIIRELTPLGGATPSFALIDQGGSAWDMGFELGTNAPCLLVALQGTGGRMVGCSVSDAISTADTTTMVSVEAAGCNITDCTITGNGQLIVGTLGSCTENAYLITKGCHFRCDASTDFAVTLAGPGAIIGDCTWDGTATNGLLLSGGNASAHACLLG
ncbi:MAG: glycosyl hydrolase family 28-related protein, partial [Terriglobales bacterium]